MPLKSLEIRNFRVYEQARLDLEPKFNLITGSNASGKTSLLEAIHFLASGKSFRSTSAHWKLFTRTGVNHLMTI